MVGGEKAGRNDTRRRTGNDGRKQLLEYEEEEERKTIRSPFHSAAYLLAFMRNLLAHFLGLSVFPLCPVSGTTTNIQDHVPASPPSLVIVRASPSSLKEWDAGRSEGNIIVGGGRICMTISFPLPIEFYLVEMCLCLFVRSMKIVTVLDGYMWIHSISSTGSRVGLFE